MLDSISWQAFFTTVVAILGGYYLIATLLLYRSEIISIFKHRNADRPGIDATLGHGKLTESRGLMGSVRLEDSWQHVTPREEVTNIDELNVALSHEVEEPVNVIDPADELLLSDFIMIQTEIASLAEIASQSTREENSALFKTLLSNYPHFPGTEFQSQVSQVIHDACRKTGAHQFSLHEINAWWASENSNPESH